MRFWIHVAIVMQQQHKIGSIMIGQSPFGRAAAVFGSALAFPVKRNGVTAQKRYTKGRDETLTIGVTHAGLRLDTYRSYFLTGPWSLATWTNATIRGLNHFPPRIAGTLINSEY